MSKIPVAILGATGTVGQMFIRLLEDHPWFEVAELAASERSAGRRYRDACRWRQPTPLPDRVAALEVAAAGERLTSQLLFSGLDSRVAGPLESDYAAQGHIVISNSKNHRMDVDVPLVIPEINSDHLQIIRHQRYSGAIITNSNCSTMFLAMALAPLQRRFGVRQVQVTTLQAVSGAGWPGEASLDIVANVIPHIAGEEQKMEQEAAKILGRLEGDHIEPADFVISAQCTRVPVIDGHTESVSVALAEPATPQEVVAALRSFKGPPQELQLPSAPRHPIVVLEAADRPQPRRDLWVERGMATVVGRVRPCPVLGIKMMIMGHNTVRGAAGAAILNAEMGHQQRLWPTVSG